MDLWIIVITTVIIIFNHYLICKCMSIISDNCYWFGKFQRQKGGVIIHIYLPVPLMKIGTATKKVVGNVEPEAEVRVLKKNPQIKKK